MLRPEIFTSYSLYFDGSEMSEDETEFLLAMASYQKRFHRRYPTWREVLNVLRCLGYRKVAEAVAIDEPKPPLEAPDPPAKSEFEIMKAKFERAKAEPP